MTRLITVLRYWKTSGIDYGEEERTKRLIIKWRLMRMNIKVLLNAMRERP